MGQFSTLRTNCAILTSYIRAHPRTCLDRSRGCCHVSWWNGESCEIHTAKAGNKVEKKNQGPSVYFYALKKVCFSGSGWITSGSKSNFIRDNIPTKAILFFFGCSEVNSTWLITSELANQPREKRYSLVWYILKLNSLTGARERSALITVRT